MSDVDAPDRPRARDQERPAEGAPGPGGDGPRGDGPAGDRPPAEPARLRKAPFLLAGLLVLAALAWGAWGRWEENALAETAQRQVRTFEPALRFAEARRDDKPVALTLPGQTLAFATARLFARATGYVAERSVDIGSRVKAGSVMARIAAPDLDQQLAQAQAQLGQVEAQVQQAQAQVQQAQANVELANLTNDRQSTLSRQGWSPRQTSDNTRADLDSRQADLAAAQAGVAVAEANRRAQAATVDRLRELAAFELVVAPFDGVVTERNIEQGDLVTADANSGSPLFTLERDDVLRVQVYVPQSTAVGIENGLAAEVRVPELPGRAFAGKVARTSGALDAASRTLLTEVDVPNPDGRLHSGLFVDVDLAVPRGQPRVDIPAEAIIFDSKGLRVAVLDGDRVRMRPITIARDFGTSVEIHEGLGGGEQVALNAPVDLADGQKVKVQRQP